MLSRIERGYSTVKLRIARRQSTSLRDGHRLAFSLAPAVTELVCFVLWMFGDRPRFGISFLVAFCLPFTWVLTLPVALTVLFLARREPGIARTLSVAALGLVLVYLIALVLVFLPGYEPSP